MRKVWGFFAIDENISRKLLDPDVASSLNLNSRGGARMEATYRIQAFARLAGVTVRALHHYDRIGLLTPERTSSGYRVYTASHLERLEQIVALRFLGLPLKEIAEVIGRERRSLPAVLAAQRRMLLSRRHQLDRAIAAIEHAETAVHAGQPTTTLLTRIIEEIAMQEQTEFMNRYYNEPAQAALENRRKEWNPADQDKVTEEWRALFRDVKASLQEDPASPHVQSLVDRWNELIGRFTGGNPDVTSGLNKAWADRANWPVDMKQQSGEFFDQQVWDFMAQARAARKQ
jgi:DNA-binding transcriptional MerR regulator